MKNCKKTSNEREKEEWIKEQVTERKWKQEGNKGREKSERRKERKGNECINVKGRKKRATNERNKGKRIKYKREEEKE